jgi:hypothetical protein
MDFKKSHWVADGSRVSLSVPFAKIDKENRLVTGFATLDNIDSSDDVVTAEASKAAFAAARGNVREMHQPIAAGRVVDFKEEEFFHDGQFYRGIFVTTYVSKGAQDTWEKVLDGTLSGFSIGGNITEQETKFVKDAGPNGKNIRFIKGYDLIELSLVDNPANQLANILTVVKNSEGSFIKGMVAETTIVNIFWCSTDEVAKNSEGESETCLACGNAMEQIGWFEKGEDNAVKTAAAVADFLRQKEVNTAEQADNTAHGEGGVQMGNKINKDAESANDEQKDVVTSDDVVDAEEVNAEEVAEGAQAPEDTNEVSEEFSEHQVEAQEEAEAEAQEEAAGEPDLEKMFDDLKDSVKDSIAKTVEAVEAKVTEATAAFDAKASEFEKSLGELSEKLEAIKTEREDVAKRLDALEKASAIRKSGEVEGTEPVTKSKGSFWGSAFFDEG